MQLIKNFAPEEYANALESWSWLDIGGKTPVLATAFGDVFLKAEDGYWFLDTIEGVLKHVAATKEELQAILNTPQGQDEYLLAGLAIAMEDAGVVPAEKEVYDFTVPPRLGGKIEPSNVKVMDFVVALNLAGQLHDQIRNVPPGTKISGVKFDQ